MATQHKAVHIQLAMQIDQCIRDLHSPPVAAVASAPAATTILFFYVDFDDDEAAASVLRANLAEILELMNFPAT